ncbi:MAG: alkaline shock response membrane anchor protein AmaP, partial [Lactococcus garvieae]
IALLIIAFYPRTYIDIELPTQGGKLTLKRSAIEGLVREKVLENDFLKSPRINVTLYKKKISIDVKGEIIPRVEIAEKSRLLEQEIIDSLKLFFGVDQPVKIKVEVNALNKETNNKRSRVV